MLKKVLVLLLTLCMVITPVLASAASSEEILHQTVEILDGLSRDIMIPALPFLSTNSGLDMLEDALNKEINGEDAGAIMGPAIQQALTYTDAETLQKLIDTFRVFSESFRGKLQSYYQNQTAMSLSTDAAKGMDLLLAKLNEKESGLSAALEKHGLSAGVIANMMAAIAEENGSQPMFKLQNGEFSLNYYNKTICNGLDSVWTDASFSSYLDGLANRLNTAFTSIDQTAAIALLKSTGLLKVVTTGGGGGTGGGTGGGGTGTTNNSDKTDTTDKTDKTDKTDTTTPTETVSFEVTEAGTVSRDYSGTMPVVYRVEDGKETPVKMAVYADGKIIADLAAGSYVIREAVPYFTDCETWGKTYIEALYARGIISGKGEGLFMPNQTITREEFVKLIVEMFDLLDETAVSSFSDVDANAWYAPYVASAEKHGIISGVSATEFGVGASIKRQDMAKIISTLLGEKNVTMQPADTASLSDYDTIADYAKEHVLAICGLGIVSGDENRCFNPSGYATRQEAAKMLYGMLEAILKAA